MKTSQRAYYKGTRTLEPSTLEGGVLKDGVEREVFVDGDTEEPVVVESYTLRETAAALDKSLLTIRSWMNNGIIPPCVLADTTCGYRHYSRGELEILAELVAEHECNYAYLRTNHTETIQRISDAFAAHREEYV